MSGNIHTAQIADKIRKKQILRLMAEMLAAGLLALIIELGFNFHGITEGYDPKGIYDHYTTEGGRLIYELKLDQPEYVDKLIIQGNVKKDLKYTVKLVTVSDMGGLEEKSFQDYLYTELNCGFSNINARVKELSISITKPDRVEVSSISYENQFAFNKYRFCFFLLTGFLVLLILVEHRMLLEKIWVLYLICTLGFGSIMAVGAGPFAVTWDEEVHYRTVHLMNPTGKTSSDEVIVANFERQGWKLNTTEELAMMRAYMDSHGNGTEIMEGYHGFRKEYITYFPMILSYQLGRLLGLPYSLNYMLGRLGNLVFCSLICALAVFLARRKKLLIAIVGMMPTVIFQSSMYTYDGVMFSFLLLGTVLCMNELEKERGTENIRGMILAAIAILVGCMAKPVYIPLLLLLVPCVYGKIKPLLTGKRRRRIAWTALVILGVLAAAVLAVKLKPFISSALSGDLSYGGDSRGGKTGMAGQLLTILQHPIAFGKMLVRDIFTFDNFRNYQDNGENVTLIFSQMFLNLYELGTLKNLWTMVLVPLLMLLYLVEPEGEKALPGNIKQIRKWNLAAIFLSVILIWLAMYLAFTPIGQGSISGVQARYYLPLCIPAAYVLWNRRIQIKLPRLRYYQIGMGAALVLTSQCVYQFLICGRLS